MSGSHSVTADRLRSDPRGFDMPVQDQEKALLLPQERLQKDSTPTPEEVQWRRERGMRKLAAAIVILTVAMSSAQAQGGRWGTLFLARLTPVHILGSYAGREAWWDSMRSPCGATKQRPSAAPPTGSQSRPSCRSARRRRWSPSPGSPSTAAWCAAPATASLPCRSATSSATGMSTSPARSSSGRRSPAPTASNAGRRARPRDLCSRRHRVQAALSEGRDSDRGGTRHHAARGIAVAAFRGRRRLRPLTAAPGRSIVARIPGPWLP